MSGTRLGPWEIEREVGRGGMGCVYLARNTDPAGTPERAAVKVLAAHLTFDAGSLSRWQREIEVLRQLDHPHVVRLFDSGNQNGRRYYVMEYVDGPSLEAVLAERRRLPWPEVLEIALQVCLALKHAHDRGVIHRDIKPSNLLCGPASANYPGGVVKLTDFGIAWIFAGEHLTVTGAVVGTAEYLSPEQAAGKTPTKKSDLYSLGAVLYTLLTGRPPFEGETVDLLHKHRYGQFERPTRLVPEVPHEVEEVVCELLEKDPAARPPDAGVLHHRLESLRRKYERRAGEPTRPGVVGDDTAVDKKGSKGKKGPATLVADMVRAELDHQKYGGPIKRFFNHPIVLVILFLATVGLIVWAFLPPGPERLHQRAAALMASDEPEDWEEALPILNELDERHPDHPFQEEVAAFRKKAESARDVRQANRNARLAGPMSEAHWFYEKGLRLRQQGKTKEAEEVWRRLVEAFDDVPAEEVWVSRARGELEKPSGRERTGDERWKPVQRALIRAKELEADGKAAEARAIRESLRRLYADDPSARAALPGLFDGGG